MHEYFRPWGQVTPDFWAATAPPHPGSEQPAGNLTQHSTSAEASSESKPGVTAALPTEAERQLPARGANGSHQSPSARAAGETPETDLPPGFQERIASVTAAFASPEDRHALALAAIEAEKLDQELTGLYGQNHTYTVNLRELRGWLAYLAGDAGTAARWYLHTTGLQLQTHGPAHTQTHESVRRAVHTWQQVTDPEDIIQIGTDLAKVVSTVLGPDSEAARYMQTRLSRHRQPRP